MITKPILFFLTPFVCFAIGLSARDDYAMDYEEENLYYGLEWDEIAQDEELDEAIQSAEQELAKPAPEQEPRHQRPRVIQRNQKSKTGPMVGVGEVDEFDDEWEELSDDEASFTEAKNTQAPKKSPKSRPKQKNKYKSYHSGKRPKN